ncbi:MAG: 2-succinyl-5-enolpyruvyl-6-hydroxy-3-cyclohexene-1-carboxylic-acid synthase [Verrucomicrobia bacterium]|nr:2-succinyl-5-enolpyruvyl-6-hydroxy-3-cyclohexene-1-carboxylic-acid synthase [Verrucomicrobiota bacterium]
MNTVWASLVVEELLRNGVDTVCLSPGSRCAPLTVAVARHENMRSVMHFDERGAAFFALGYARATGRPAAWVTTSGTAAANGLPAVIEAAQDKVPMIVITADRPPELRDTGANQSIHQPDLFSRYVRWSFDVPCPDAAIPPEFVLTTVDQAVYRAFRTPSGPVHLNMMFREPLDPTVTGDVYSSYLDSVSDWSEHRHAYTRYSTARVMLTNGDLKALLAECEKVQRGLLCVGHLRSEAERAAVRSLAGKLGWPVLADVTSGVSWDPTLVENIRYYDQILLSPVFRNQHKPDGILHIGDRFVSKRLLQFIDENRPTFHCVVNEGPERADPAHTVTHRIESDLVKFCEALASGVSPQTGTEWRSAWKRASDAVHDVINEFLAGQCGINEPHVARRLSSLVPSDQFLVLASSMPIRECDMYAGMREGEPVCVSNRGASGIDGTIATASGVAHGAGKGVTVLIGDLALLHDLNSLALVASSETPVIVVVLNNHGGAIFSFLPIRKQKDIFEPFFGTPHELDFKGAARQFGITYHRPRDIKEFDAAYQSAVEHGKSALIEIITDRKENFTLHAQLQSAIAKSIDTLE